MTFHTRFKHPRPKLKCEDKSRTRQEFKDESNINNIIKRYQSTGVLVDPLTVNRRRVPQFADVSNVPDLQQAYEIVHNARDAFASLSPELRDKFGNSPEALVAFVLDGRNRKAAEELGLISKAALDANLEPPTKSEGGNGDKPPKEDD